MSGNANKIVIAVVAVLVLAMAFLFVGAGSFSGGGGGGAPSSVPAGSGASAISYENEDYETMRDELMQQLTEGTALIGSNARKPQDNAEKILTVSEARAALKERGIGDDAVITSSFTMSGDYIGATELDGSSSDKYPSYRVK